MLSTTYHTISISWKLGLEFHLDKADKRIQNGIAVMHKVGEKPLADKESEQIVLRLQNERTSYLNPLVVPSCLFSASSMILYLLKFMVQASKQQSSSRFASQSSFFWNYTVSFFLAVESKSWWENHRVWSSTSRLDFPRRFCPFSQQKNDACSTHSIQRSEKTKGSSFGTYC